MKLPLQFFHPATWLTYLVKIRLQIRVIVSETSWSSHFTHLQTIIMHLKYYSQLSMYVMRLHLNVLVITNIRSLMTQNVWRRHVMAQAVICRHHTAKTRALSHALQCGFYDLQSTTGIDIIWLLQYYSPNIITLILLKHLYIYCRFYIILAMTVSYINTKTFHAFHSDVFSLLSLSVSYTVKAMTNIAGTLHRNGLKQPEISRGAKLSPSSDRKWKQNTYSRAFIINM
jgi:hypothetical protein